MPDDTKQLAVRGMTDLERSSETEKLAARTVDFIRASVSKSTRQVYQSAWTRFESWCAERGYESLPASAATVQLYATALITEGVPGLDGSPGKPVGLSTLDVHLAAIIHAHDLPGVLPEGRENPGRALPKLFRKGARQELAKPPNKKAWLSLDQILDSFDRLSDHEKSKPQHIRDRALLLVGFMSGGRRRSEVAGMRVEHLRKAPTGSWVWTLPRTKTHPEGCEVVIRKTGDSGCAVAALERWLAISQIKSGPVFRRTGGESLVPSGLSGQHVANVVKAAAERLGLDPDDYAGHSVRSGFATDMARKGVRLEDIMDATKHTSYEVAMGYVRQGRALAEDDPITRAVRKGRDQ